MAEINLLKTPGVAQNPWQSISTWVVRVLAVGALVVLVYYVYLFIQVGSANKKITQVQTDISKGKAAALSQIGRDELLIRQEQLKDFTDLSSGHAYYSSLLPALAKITLKNAYYTSISVSSDGKLNMQVVVPSLGDLDKFLQVFNQPEVVKNFYNLRMAGFSKAGDQTGTVYNFSVQMDFNRAILTTRSVAG